jgi:hypothetical protein
MANPEHLEILNLGVQHWNKWREEHRGVQPDLSKARLHAEFLSGADFRQVNLTGVDLSDANLKYSNLTEANLSGANLSEAYLENANLMRANLSAGNLRGADLLGAKLIVTNLVQANLRGANLFEVYIYGALLAGADFTGARIAFTDFADVDLSSARGLDSAEHSMPSTIGIDTIYRSSGKIPEVFLRGCGVPDEFIAYIGSMVGRPIEFYSSFISYSTLDQEFAERLYADLQAKGVRCWFAPHDVRAGRKLHEQIDAAIRLHDKLLLILSENSMNSEWVKTEIARARKREVKEGKRVLFPVRLVPFEVLRGWECFDGDTGKDSAREIREYFIPDFSNWKDHDSYQTAFDRLLKDLKAEASK